jgi:hypothetical protein
VALKELAALAALTTLLNVCCKRELGVVGGVEFFTSPAILDFLLPHKLDWLPMLDMLEFLLLENGLPDLPRLLGTLPPSWNIDSGSDWSLVYLYLQVMRAKGGHFVTGWMNYVSCGH